MVSTIPFARLQPPSTIAATWVSSSGSSPAGRYTRATSNSATCSAPGQRERHILEPEAGDLFDHVDLARDVAGAPGRRLDLAVLRVEAEAGQPAELIVGRGREPDQLVGPLGPEPDHGPRRQPLLH